MDVDFGGKRDATPFPHREWKWNGDHEKVGKDGWISVLKKTFGYRSAIHVPIEWSNGCLVHMRLRVGKIVEYKRLSRLSQFQRKLRQCMILLKTDLRQSCFYSAWCKGQWGDLDSAHMSSARLKGWSFVLRKHNLLLLIGHKKSEERIKAYRDRRHY